MNPITKLKQRFQPSEDQQEEIQYGSWDLLLPMALNEVNNLRLACAIGEGKLPELPKGIMGNPSQCVLARALSNGWSCNIDGDGIFLQASKEVEVDIQKTVETLERLDYTVKSWDESEYYGRNVMIAHTWITETFISAFDNRQFPSLVQEQVDVF